MNGLSKFVTLLIVVGGFAIGFAIAMAITSSITSADAGFDFSCVPLTYHHYMICEYPPGDFTNYTAGIEEVVLTGKIPEDNRLDGKDVRLWGSLVQNGSCTILNVERWQSCSLPTTDR